MIYNDDLNIANKYKSLDLEHVLNYVSNFAISESAKEKIFNLSLLNDRELITELLKEQDNAIELIKVHLKDPNFAFTNLNKILSDVEKNIVVSIKDLIKIRLLLVNSRHVKSAIEDIEESNSNLLKYTKQIYVDINLENDIDKSVLSDTELSDNASFKLKEIRRRIRALNDKMRQTILSYMSKSSYSDFMQENIYTIRSDRYVIPVKSEHKNSVKGLVHDRSSTGSTIYIEPYEIIELNNDLALAKLEEKQEILAILRNFTQKIKQISNSLLITQNSMISLDIIFSKAKYALSINATRPIITSKEINIINGRHPMINKDLVVPVSIKIPEEKRILIVTGSNTGGKTVSLKLVGILTLMTMLGMYIPADDGSKICVFDEIYYDIGDDQSIEYSLSTFSSHMSNIKYILENATSSSLVLFDELAMGTDPHEGVALALAISEYLKNNNITSIITTHYYELKEYAMQNLDIQIAAMGFDPVTYKPTYNIIFNTAGSSNALNIAKILGIKQSIIDSAQTFISEDYINFDSIIKNAQKQIKEIEDEKRELESIKTQISNERDLLNNELKSVQKLKQNLLDNAKKETRKLIDSYIFEANNIVEEIKQIRDHAIIDREFDAYRLKKNLDNLEIKDEEINEFKEKESGVINIGDAVFIKSLNKEAEVVKINTKKKEYIVSYGLCNIAVDFDNVYKIKNKFKKNKSIDKRNYMPLDTSVFKTEIMLLGLTVAEAVNKLDRYIDSALSHGVEHVTIIHGKGTGALRKGVHEYLKDNKSIKSYRLGNYNEGDSGVTIVELNG